MEVGAATPSSVLARRIQGQRSLVGFRARGVERWTGLRDFTHEDMGFSGDM